MVNLFWSLVDFLRDDSDDEIADFRWITNQFFFSSSSYLSPIELQKTKKRQKHHPKKNGRTPCLSEKLGVNACNYGLRCKWSPSPPHIQQRSIHITYSDGLTDGWVEKLEFITLVAEMSCQYQYHINDSTAQVNLIRFDQIKLNRTDLALSKSNRIESNRVKSSRKKNENQKKLPKRRRKRTL